MPVMVTLWGLMRSAKFEGSLEYRVRLSVSLRYGGGVGWERKGTKAKKMRRSRKRWVRRKKRVQEEGKMEDEEEEEEEKAGEEEGKMQEEEGRWVRRRERYWQRISATF